MMLDSMKSGLSIEPEGEDCIMLRLPEPFESNYPLALSRLQSRLKEQFEGFIVECVPAYRSLLLVCDLSDSSYSQKFEQLIESMTLIWEAIKLPSEVELGADQVRTIPVCFDREFGLDLPRLSKGAGMLEAQYVERFTSLIYDVCAVGFLPGFAYMGTVDPLLAAPRLKHPRKRIPAGSLGIADQQTGIYPSDSPGGWNIIGRTPSLSGFTSSQMGSMLRVGDRVRFEPIDRARFEVLSRLEPMQEVHHAR